MKSHGSGRHDRYYLAAGGGAAFDQSRAAQLAYAPFGVSDRLAARYSGHGHAFTNEDRTAINGLCLQDLRDERPMALLPIPGRRRRASGVGAPSPPKN